MKFLIILLTLSVNAFAASKFDDPVWFEENIKKPYAKNRAKELGIEYKDTGDLKEKHEDFFKTPVGIKLKRFGLIF